MGVLRANALGIFLSIGSVLTSVVITALLDLTTETAVLLIGGLMIISDLIFRWRSSKISGWRKLISGQAGGQFVILPVWGLGIIFFIMGIVG